MRISPAFINRFCQHSDTGGRPEALRVGDAPMLRELLSQHAPKFNTRSQPDSCLDWWVRTRKGESEVGGPNAQFPSIFPAVNFHGGQGQTEGNDDLNLNKQNFREDLHSVHLTELQKLQQLWHRPSFKCWSVKLVWTCSSPPQHGHLLASYWAIFWHPMCCHRAEKGDETPDPCALGKEGAFHFLPVLWTHPTVTGPFLGAQGGMDLLYPSNH